MKTIDMDDARPPGGSGGGDGPGGNRFQRSPEFGGAKKMMGVGALVLAIFVIVSLGASGNLGVIELEDNQVAVKMNYISGEKEVITEPGYKIFIPFIQKVFILDKTPQKFLMLRGGGAMDDNHGPHLSVRASDGSNLWFEELEIQYSILPGSSDAIIEDSGVDDGFKRDWIRAFARSVLRDEFGRFSSVEVADPSNYSIASDRSVQRLNEFLNAHGILVERIITPKPRFDKRYEDAIEERKVADQDVERLRVKEGQLLQERAQQLALVEKEKEIQWQELLGDLKRFEIEAQRDAIAITKGADRYKVTREAEGQQQLDRSLADARGLVSKYTKEAEGIRARTAALEKRGRVVVREALIEKLSSIRFTLIPYSRDPMPERLEHSGLNEAGVLSASSKRGKQQ